MNKPSSAAAERLAALLCVARFAACAVCRAELPKSLAMFQRFWVLTARTSF